MFKITSKRRRMFMLCMFATVLGLVECQPPVSHHITLTVHTETKTWNEAVEVCQSGGGRLLDITYFSLYSTVLQKSQLSPWKDIPLGNGPPFWLGLHRQTNLIGEEYYSGQCKPLSDFRVVYWDSDDPYNKPSGPETAECVYDRIEETHFPNGVSSKHLYSRADCSERHRFICLYQSQDPCHFDLISNYYGDTGADFSPHGDIVVPYTTTEDCASLCLSESSIFPHPYLKVDEECWGFSILSGDCHIHIVVKPSYFDLESSSRVYSRRNDLHIKRCFTATVNTSITTVTSQGSNFPNTTCGYLNTKTSTMTFPEVTLFEGVFTWNEAFQLCSSSGLQLLKLRNKSDTKALAQVVEKYNHIGIPTVWLGLHEPDPDRPNMRQWADCEYETFTDWYESPSQSLEDTRLCVVVDSTSSFTWKTEECNGYHHVICMEDESDDEPSYSQRQVGVVGDGPSIGPILGLSRGTCEHLCSNTTYMDKECWAFAHLMSTGGACYLYFSHDRYYYNTHVLSANASLVFYRKMVWSESLEEEDDLGTTDTSLFPYSCCDVTNPPLNCSDENNDHTTVSTILIDTNEAFAQCYQSVNYPYSRDEGRCRTVSPSPTLITIQTDTIVASEHASESAITMETSLHLTPDYSSSHIQPSSVSIGVMTSSSESIVDVSPTYDGTVIYVYTSYGAQDLTEHLETYTQTSAGFSFIYSSLDSHWSLLSAEDQSTIAPPISGSLSMTYSETPVLSTISVAIYSLPYTSMVSSLVTDASQSIILSASTTAFAESSSLTTTIEPPRNNTFFPRAIYLCPCFCRPENFKGLSLQELERLLRDEYTIHAKNTSRYRRAVTSAWDSRTSSVSIGSTAILLLAGLGLFLVIVDIPIVAKNVKQIHGHPRPKRNVKDKKENKRHAKSH